MTYIIRGKNFEIGDRTKEKIEAKVSSIEKIIPPDATINIAVNRGKLKYKTDITLKHGKIIVRSETENEDMMSSVDEATENLERQLLKLKGRSIALIRRNYVDPGETAITEETADSAPVIESSKKFEIVLMEPDEAVEQMELLGHDFFVFLNTASGVVNVVYKRKNGNYGLIEPEV